MPAFFEKAPPVGVVTVKLGEAYFVIDGTTALPSRAAAGPG